MDKRKIIVVIGILLILATLIGYKLIKQKGDTLKLIQSEEDVHYHAGFVVFDNGVKVDFSDVGYMNITPCTEHGPAENETPEHLQMEKAHLHDAVGDVVHSHREGAKWADLFTNIGYEVDYSIVTAYINGEKVTGIKEYPIKAYDSMVLFIGNSDESLLSESVGIDHIKEVEKKSENCGE